MIRSAHAFPRRYRLHARGFQYLNQLTSSRNASAFTAKRYTYLYFQRLALARNVHCCRNTAVVGHATAKISLLPSYSRSILTSSSIRWLSASASNNSSGSNNNRSSFWKRFAWMVRTMRIPVIVLSVYSLGYQQGIIECTKHPEALQQQILNSLLAGQGMNRGSVDIVLERDISFLSRNPHHQVASVGHTIVCAARDYVQQELEQAMAQFQKDKLPSDIAPEKALELMKQDEEILFWYNAALRLIGEANSSSLIVDIMTANFDDEASSSRDDTNGKETQAASEPKTKRGGRLKPVPWQYIFVESEDPNAFVSEVLPRRFFITTSMLDLATNRDELAMVLGHEISHLILGHVSTANQVETMLRTVEVLLLSLDPTSGLLSLVFIGALATLRTALSAAHSRENEREADDLGIVLAARACYDTEAGAVIMKKMHEHKESLAPGRRGSGTAVSSPQSSSPSQTQQAIQLLDSHPPTMERYYHLRQLAEEGENYTKYRDDQCATMSSRIAAALGWGK